MSQVASSSKRGRARAPQPGPQAPEKESRPKAFSVFIPAVEADAGLRERLRAHLHPLERAGLLDTTTKAGLADADIVLPIVSIDFLNADTSSGHDMDEALERNRQRINRVIPIIARPCLWDATPFAGLQALPHHARAISSAPSEEETLVDIVRGVRAICEQMRSRANAG